MVKGKGTLVLLITFLLFHFSPQIVVADDGESTVNDIGSEKAIDENEEVEVNVTNEEEVEIEAEKDNVSPGSTDEIEKDPEKRDIDNNDDPEGDDKRDIDNNDDSKGSGKGDIDDNDDPVEAEEENHSTDEPNTKMSKDGFGFQLGDKDPRII